MKPKDLWEIVRATLGAWSEDKVPRLGAALAYYTVFSIAPLLIMGIAICGLAFGEDAARGRVVEQIQGAVGRPAAEAIQSLILHTQQTGSGALATAIGAGMLLFGSLGVFVELQDALNTIWKVAPRPGRPVLEIVRERFLSFLMVLSIGFLLLASLAVTAVVSALNRYLACMAVPGEIYAWQALNGAVSFAFITVLFAMIYKVLPDARIRWKDVWLGSLVAALLFTAGKFLIGLYLGHASVASTYGAAGSLVIILVWVYYSAQIFLLGAEFIRIYAARRGTPVMPADHAVSIAPARPAD